jgi:branched-chain amino acid transport system substrate-binding protein
MRGRWKRPLAAVSAVVLVVGLGAAASFAATAGHATAAKSPVKVGIIYSRTGLLSAYGAEYIEGLQLGLNYATNGTGAVNGHKLELNVVDDGTDPAKAVTAAKDMIGQGYKIIAGTASSGIALQLAPLAAQNKILYISGAAASDAITGANRYTFRAGRQSYQDVLAANSYLKGAGKKVVVFAQDSAFGNGNYAAVQAVLGGKGHSVSKIVVPLSATDFTPFAAQLKQANPDMVFVAWAGTTAPAMWQALDQQGVLSSTTVVTGLAERASWGTFGQAGTKIKYIAHYVSAGPNNKVNDWLLTTMKKRNQVPDLFTPDGFVTAQMIVRAVGKADGDSSVDAMISALENWQFLAPKGMQRIRPDDHAMLQPMFQVKLVAKGSKFAPVVTKRISPGNVQPPDKPFPSS